MENWAGCSAPRGSSNPATSQDAVGPQCSQRSPKVNFPGRPLMQLLGLGAITGPRIQH